MTDRELWQATMHYGEYDRPVLIHWWGWEETNQRWAEEGMPPGINQNKYFDAASMWSGIGANLGLYPAFEEEVVEETDEYRIFRDSEGVVQQDWKHKSCIPHYIDFTLKTADDWPEYKKRLQPDPARIPDNLDQSIDDAENRGWAVAVGVASLMGWTRNWMGVENMSYLLYDDLDCYAEIVDTLADLTCWSLDQVLPRMKSTPDLGFGWEDICGKSGPLVSPHLFDKAVAPGYQKIRNKLNEYGVKILGIDSDGYVEPLIQHWMDAGVNMQFPIEYGTWHATPEDIRRKFGKELRIVGGFNKLVLEKGRDAIDAEVDRHIDLMREGGFVMMPDHLITPGVPLDDYKYYLDRVRAIRF